MFIHNALKCTKVSYVLNLFTDSYEKQSISSSFLLLLKKNTNWQGFTAIPENIDEACTCSNVILLSKVNKNICDLVNIYKYNHERSIYF